MSLVDIIQGDHSLRGDDNYHHFNSFSQFDDDCPFHLEVFLKYNANLTLMNVSKFKLYFYTISSDLCFSFCGILFRFPW